MGLTFRIRHNQFVIADPWLIAKSPLYLTQCGGNQSEVTQECTDLVSVVVFCNNAHYPGRSLILMTVMCAFWLYIVKHELQAEGYTLALSISPKERDLNGGKLQTANYQSWHQLSEILSQAGVTTGEIANARLALDAEGFGTLREISLSPEQLHSLGFRA